MFALVGRIDEGPLPTANRKALHMQAESLERQDLALEIIESDLLVDTYVGISRRMKLWLTFGY